MTWAIIFGVWGTLTGLVFYTLAPDRDFRQSMTKTEKVAVAQGQTITKVYKGSPHVFGSKAYDQGPLRIKPGEKGKPVFEPYGDWKQVDKHGNLRTEYTYTGVGNETFLRAYFLDGSPDVLMYTVPAVLNGDSVRDHRLVYFKVDQPTDTLIVQHFIEKDGKEIEKQWSFDAAGKRPVPEGWKFSRF